MEETTMYLNHYADFGVRTLIAVAIVLALGSVFEFGHSTSLAGLLYQLLGS
jgi:hypothetical protein